MSHVLFTESVLPYQMRILVVCKKSNSVKLKVLPKQLLRCVYIELNQFKVSLNFVSVLFCPKIKSALIDFLHSAASCLKKYSISDKIKEKSMEPKTTVYSDLRIKENDKIKL